MMRRGHIWFLCYLSLIFTALFFITGCERPDPEQDVTAVTATPVSAQATSTPIVIPTSVPPQVYVVVVPPSVMEPTAAATEENTLIIAPQPTATPTPEPLPTENTSAQILDDYYRENYFLGWARTDVLTVFRNHVFASVSGLNLLDKPSEEGESVGLVIGLSDLIVAGRSRCGYTPVLVHAMNMLEVVTPRPEVELPVPLGISDTPTPLGRLYPEGTTAGWAYTSEMVAIGQNAIAGPLGLNLRAEPCQGAENLGFVPSAADLVITGRPIGDYTPVLVKNDILQLPFDSPGAREIPVTATPIGPISVAQDVASQNQAFISPTPGPTTTASPTATESP